MKVVYDKSLDIIHIKLSDDKIAESDEEKQGIILDYAENGNVVSIEILNASKKIQQPNKVEYESA